MSHHDVWLGIEKKGDVWYELNGQALKGDKVDWADDQPSFNGDCAVASKEIG